jgi:hypothetical protein
MLAADGAPCCVASWTQWAAMHRADAESVAGDMDLPAPTGAPALVVQFAEKDVNRVRWLYTGIACAAKLRLSKYF